MRAEVKCKKCGQWVYPKAITHLDGNTTVKYGSMTGEPQLWSYRCPQGGEHEIGKEG